MRKQKAKAINAVLRKESNTFDGYFKYEVTIENKDGTTELIPAYGKDLQDALSRVVHDRKVQKILPVVSKVPDVVWMLLWFIVIGVITTYITSHVGVFGDAVGLVFIASIAVITSLSLAIRNYFTFKNPK